MAPASQGTGLGSARLGYLHTFGPHADPTTSLIWALLVLSVLVVITVGLFLLGGVLRGRPSGPETVEAGLAVRRDSGGLAWIYIGLAMTVVALTGTLIWTVDVLAATNSPSSKPAFVIHVTGQQWWWNVVYSPDDPTQSFATANEIHIPVGRPVEVKLSGADVIHSFWVPALAGKTDAIPGRTNVTWLHASQAGTYRGQCTEYCGAQHAQMGFYVVADPPAAFDAWRQNQLRPAAMQRPGAAGESLFVQRCGTCHTVRGTEAGGVLGPDLTHLMTRKTLAAGTLPNTPGALARWIADPQAVKPGARMPATHLAGAELGEICAYLGTLT